MKNSEAIECIECELRVQRQEYGENVFNEILSDSIYFCSTLSIAGLSSILIKEVPLDKSLSLAIIIGIILSIKNHNEYSFYIDNKNNIKILKEIKKTISKGQNPFENIEKSEFKTYIKKYYNYSVHK